MILLGRIVGLVYVSAHIQIFRGRLDRIVAGRAWRGVVEHFHLVRIVLDVAV